MVQESVICAEHAWARQESRSQCELTCSVRKVSRNKCFEGRKPALKALVLVSRNFWHMQGADNALGDLAADEVAPKGL